jgi:ABC-type sulfate/molybdate transport systems ATPase subunit
VSVVVRANGLGADRGGRTVLDDVSLDLERGEVVALLGPNGAGKTTLLTLLAGIARPERGNVERAGRVATALQAPAMARRTVLANVEAGLAWWGVPRPQRRQRALRALEAVGMGTMTGRAARSLSGGEARRVHLARVLATEPDALLLDEPFAGLDVSARADLLYAAASILREPRRATLIVVHDRAEAWALADRVVVLLDGRVAAAGAPEEVFRRPPTARAAAFLGFGGQVTDGDGVLRVRPEDVALDDAGPLLGRVTRRVPLEEGARLEVDVPNGRLVVSAPIPGPGPGDVVRLRVSGGVRYARDEADEPQPPDVPSTGEGSQVVPFTPTEGGT